MPVKLRTPKERAHLSPSQLQELWLGPSHEGSVFETREELEDAWKRGRDRVMAEHGRNGRRPLAFYEFEVPFAHPGLVRERSTLWRAGVLADDERVELETYWRREFEHAEALGDAAARRAHYRWADIPRSLLKQWKAERRISASACL